MFLCFKDAGLQKAALRETGHEMTNEIHLNAGQTRNMMWLDSNSVFLGVRV